MVLYCEASLSTLSWEHVSETEVLAALRMPAGGYSDILVDRQIGQYRNPPNDELDCISKTLSCHHAINRNVTHG